jgi:hypothetical protein
MCFIYFQSYLIAQAKPIETKEARSIKNALIQNGSKEGNHNVFVINAPKATPSKAHQTLIHFLSVL